MKRQPFVMQQIEHQRRQNEIKLRRAAFTAAHLDELPQTAVMYRSVGKA
jgi:chaperonin cofactor prefoldin